MAPDILRGIRLSWQLVLGCLNHSRSLRVLHPYQLPQALFPLRYFRSVRSFTRTCSLIPAPLHA